MKALLYLIQLSLLIIICSLGACKSTRDLEALQHMPSDELYEAGQQAMTKRFYSDAIDKFEALDAAYPFGVHAKPAQLSLMYAYYKMGDQPSAVATADRFIHLYPRDKNVDYAHYMRGLANFEQDRGVFINFFPVDISKRDPGTMREAYDDFSILVKRFPKSKFTPDANQRMIFLRNLFAEHELHAARYYLKRKANVAAANRASFVIENYSPAPQRQEALSILVAANKALELEQPSKNAQKVKDLNQEK